MKAVTTNNISVSRKGAAPKVVEMITRNNGDGVRLVMKLQHYLRYYQQRNGIRLTREMADKEALKEGFILDHSGESGGT